MDSAINDAELQAGCNFSIQVSLVIIFKEITSVKPGNPCFMRWEMFQCKNVNFMTVIWKVKNIFDWPQNVGCPYSQLQRHWLSQLGWRYRWLLGSCGVSHCKMCDSIYNLAKCEVSFILFLNAKKSNPLFYLMTDIDVV